MRRGGLRFDLLDFTREQLQWIVLLGPADTGK
jgi:hypothetical protein